MAPAPGATWGRRPQGMSVPFECSCLSLGTLSVPEFIKGVCLCIAKHPTCVCSMRNISNSRNSEAVLWCHFLNGLKCFSESFNASGSLSCIPWAATALERSALGVTHTGFAAVSPTGATPGSYQESAGYRRVSRYLLLPRLPWRASVMPRGRAAWSLEVCFCFCRSLALQGRTRKREIRTVSRTGAQQSSASAKQALSHSKCC